MQRTGLLICMLFCLNFSYASFPMEVKKDSTTVVDTREANRELMLRVSKMTVKEYETFTGKKMNFFERLSFKAYKRKLAARAAKSYYDDDTEGFNFGGFTAGFLLGGIGVLLTYQFSGDRNKRKWSWIGWGSWIILFLIIFLATKK